MSKPRASRSLSFAVVALVLVVGGTVAVTSWRADAAAAAQRQAALDEVAAVLAMVPSDADRLGRCVTSLKKLPGAGVDRGLLAAEASLELRRDRAEVAEELFVGLACEPGATLAEQQLAARILLRRHEADLGERGPGVLAQIRQFSEAAYQETRQPAELLRAWQATERAGQHDVSKRLAADLQRDHAEAPERRFVDYAMAFDPERSAAGLSGCIAGLEEVPAEHAAMAALVQLQAGDVPTAVHTIDAALARSPGVGVVRFAAAVVYHSCVVASGVGSDDRAAWSVRRDAQLDWLLRQPGLDDARRAACRQMRDVR